MKIRRGILSKVAALAMVGGSVLIPRGTGAQESGGDFMFHPPNVTLSFNLGYTVPTAGSDVFDETIQTFMLEKNDFHAPSIGGGIAIYMNDRIDLAFEFSYARSGTWSEYRDFIGADDLPIEQKTNFLRIPLTASVRYFLTDRGRAIGNLSWIPAEWTPYLGAGGGRMYYEFEQVGEFIDFQDPDLPIFRDEIFSGGWAWVGHVFGGIQWALSPSWVVSAEARYALADADLDRPDYSRYEPIDLSGFHGSVGFGIRF